MRDRFVDSGGVRIHVVEEGPEDGEPVLFLHGFPEFWWSWRHQLSACAEAGYRAVAMDMRGFGESDRPDDVSAYALPNAFADVSAVVATLGGRVRIVAHDWGGALGWGVTALSPDMVERLVVMNLPHPNTYAGVTSHLGQLQRSWYIFVFQFQGVAEDVLSRDGYRLLREWMYGTASVPLPAEEIDRYIEVFSRPGALTAGLNWYRANIPPASYLGAERAALPPITRPSLLVWGLDDPYLDFDLARRSGEFVDAPFALQTLAATGHWVQQERPVEVNALLLDFLSASF